MEWLHVFHQIGACATDVTMQLDHKDKMEECVLAQLSECGNVKVFSEERGSVKNRVCKKFRYR